MDEVVVDCQDLATLTGMSEDAGVPIPHALREVLELVGEPLPSAPRPANRFGLQVPGTRYVLRLGRFGDGVVSLLTALTSPIGIISMIGDARGIAKIINAFVVLDPNSGEQCVCAAVQSAQFASIRDVTSGAAESDVRVRHAHIGAACTNNLCQYFAAGCKIPPDSVSDVLHRLKDQQVVTNVGLRWSVVI